MTADTTSSRACPCANGCYPGPQAAALLHAARPGAAEHGAAYFSARYCLKPAIQQHMRRRILRVFVGRGLLEKTDAKDMLAYQHSGFSVDGWLSA